MFRPDAPLAELPAHDWLFELVEALTPDEAQTARDVIEAYPLGLEMLPRMFDQALQRLKAQP